VLLDLAHHNLPVKRIASRSASATSRRSRAVVGGLLMITRSR
jgi:hypothetical protein